MWVPTIFPPVPVELELGWELRLSISLMQMYNEWAAALQAADKDPSVVLVAVTGI